MGWTWSEKLDQDGRFSVTWDSPIIGVDTDAGDTKVRPAHLVYMENMRLQSGRVVAVNGYALLDTTMDAEDNGPAQGFGQYLTGSTETYVIVQQNGTVQAWNAAGNSWDQLTSRMTSDAGVDSTWNELNYLTYLIWGNPTDGNWKYDGTNWLPLGARIISNCEATTDWALTGTGQTGLTTNTTTPAFGENNLTFDPILLNEEAVLTFDPATGPEDAGLNSARAYLETDRFCFWFQCTDVSTLDTTATLFRVETSAGNDFDVPLSAWTDENGDVIVPADNTWHRVEHVISSGTEAGTFNMASVDNVQLVWNTNGTGGCTMEVNQVYFRYLLADTMPGVETFAVWNDVLMGAGATAATQSPSDVHFTPVNAPDEYDSTAFIAVNPDSGGSIVALKRFFNQVFIGKQNSCHSLGGTTAGTTYPNFNYEIIDITNEHGCDGIRSVVEFGKKLYFPWKATYKEYDGTGTRTISERIEPDLQDHAAGALRQKTAALYMREREIWVAYPGNGDTHNTRFFRFLPEASEFGGFTGIQDGGTALNLNILKTVYESGLEVIVGVDEAGDIMNLDPTSATASFDGTTITHTARWPWVGQADMSHYWDEIAVLFDTQSTGSITVQYRIADNARAMSGASFVTAGTVALSTATNLSWVSISEIARWIQIQFTTSNATAIPYDIQYPIRIVGSPVGRWA